MLFFDVVLPFLPLLISWRWYWWEAWVYALICIAGFAISRALAARRHPDLLAERAQFMHHENANPGISFWLRWSVSAAWWSPWWPDWRCDSEISAVQYAGEDRRADRYPGRVCLGILRPDRKPLFLRHGAHPDRPRHQVISSGPYRWMRHPAMRERC
jgi:hypothetical protein